MKTLLCACCVAPLTQREQLFESLLCVACEQRLTSYDGPLPDPNRAFARYVVSGSPMPPKLVGVAVQAACASLKIPK